MKFNSVCFDLWYAINFIDIGAVEKKLKIERLQQ